MYSEVERFLSFIFTVQYPVHLGMSSYHSIVQGGALVLTQYIHLCSELEYCMEKSSDRHGMALQDIGDLSVACLSTYPDLGDELISSVPNKLRISGACSGSRNSSNKSRNGFKGYLNWIKKMKSTYRPTRLGGYAWRPCVWLCKR